MKIRVNENLIAWVVVAFMASLPMLSFANNSHETNVLLDSLDKVLAERQTILSKKQTVINDLKRSISDVLTQEALAVKYEQIYSEYLHLNGDSAIAYAHKAVQAATKAKRPELILTAKFALLRSYTRQGMMGKAYETILDIGYIKDILPAYRAQYADQLLDFYMRVNNKDDIAYTPGIDASGAWKRYSQYLGKGSNEYLFYQAVCTKKGNLKELTKTLSNLHKPSFPAANIYFSLAIENRRRGNTEEFYNNLILAAINDILLANTEVSSLVTLLQTPLLENDLKRSYAYIKVCSDNVKRYNDMQRSLKVVSIQDRINKQFNEVRTRQMTAIIIIAILLVIALVISIIETRLLAARGRKVKRSLDVMRELHSKEMEMTKQQQALSEELRQANSRLSDRVSVYRNDFLNVYHLVSSYISYEKTARNTILNQLKTNNVRKAIRALDSTADVDGQLKHFYHHFDHAFLALYPDFIQRMNTLVRPECRFDEKATELTTSLRIYALVVLGITDSVGIADFLHLSSQTVYNYRLKMRRCSATDEKKFDDDVINLYSQNRHNQNSK